MPPQSFANSYILTTRDQPKATSKSQTFPLPNGALWWHAAPKQYDHEVTDYTAVGLQPSASPPPAFLTMLESDLQIAIANGFPQLTVVIHGLANFFSTSVPDPLRAERLEATSADPGSAGRDALGVFISQRSPK